MGKKRGSREKEEGRASFDRWHGKMTQIKKLESTQKKRERSMLLFRKNRF